ncbi:MAG: EAL domain-containing protein [Desulfonatronovibrio sp.]
MNDDNKHAQNDQDSMSKLEKRLEHLEEVNRFTLDALELASSLMDFHQSINELERPTVILEETCLRVARLINFHDMVIYLVNEEDNDFYPAYWEPADTGRNSGTDLNNLIEQGFFNWAMREKRPLTLASDTPGEHIVLHAISTSSRVRGMFLGIIRQDSSSIPDVSWSLLSIVLSGSANALESFELYKIFKDANLKLKNSVITRTKQLEIQSSYDRLTHLPNRDVICNKLKKDIVSARDSGGAFQVAFLLIDVDMFKDVNESLGHDTGDKILIQVGSRLKKIVQDDDSIARMGGDEFGIIIKGPDVVHLASETAAQIIEIMTVPFDIDGHVLVLDVSIGIALYPDHGNNMGQILSRADVAMYASKRRKTGLTVYDPTLASSGINRLSLMGELRKSLDRNELELYYQPKICLPGQTVSGVEALLRWIHPSRGFISPGEFIPLAEQGGMIRELTSRVLEMTVSRIKQWQDMGLKIKISMNLSVRDLQEGHLPEMVARVLEKEMVDPSLLEMEITESAFMTAPRKSLQALNAIHEMGVRLSIDDFGTGYSSISYLKELPVQLLKIDRSFVMEMHKHKSDAKIVKSIIDLAHNLDLKVVAEGVENQKILDNLTKLGCDMAQGFYIMKPAPVHEVTEWLRAGSRL